MVGALPYPNIAADRIELGEIRSRIESWFRMGALRLLRVTEWIDVGRRRRCHLHFFHRITVKQEFLKSNRLLPDDEISSFHRRSNFQQND
jgi:hypothetical protein